MKLLRFLYRLLKKPLRLFYSIWIRLFTYFVCFNWKPYIDNNTGIDKLAHKPLIGWLNYHQHYVLGKSVRFLGHRALKNPIDAWIYQEIIYEVKPDIVFEIGNKNGGSTLYLAGILEMMNSGRVLALDIDHSKFTVEHDRIDLITGDSTDPQIIRRVNEYCEGKSCLIIHDAAHSQEAVITDLRNYCNLVKPQSYIIVEDTFEGLRGFMRNEYRDRYETFTRPLRNTALQAVQQFVQEDTRFVIDRSREKWILTSNPYGYLKCITNENY